MEEKYTDDKLINMLSLSEEISSLNLKIKQLVEDVHADKPLLINLKELSNTLNKKVAEFNKSVSSYTPREAPETTENVPSYKMENKTRERVEPHPDDRAVKKATKMDIETFESKTLTTPLTKNPRPTKKRPLRDR